MSENVELVSIEDMAKFFAVSIATFRSWVRKEYLPKDSYFLIGKTYRFDKPKVISALLNNEELKYKGKEDWSTVAVHTTSDDVVEAVDNINLDEDM